MKTIIFAISVVIMSAASCPQNPMNESHLIGCYEGFIWGRTPVCWAICLAVDEHYSHHGHTNNIDNGFYDHIKRDEAAIIDWKHCDETSDEDFPSHPLTIIVDTPVQDECENRAKLSLPAGLVVKESGIPGAGEGVFADMFFPEGVRFGPYGGETHAYNKMDSDKSGYSWEIFCGDQKVLYTDAGDERKSNWLRYINMATNTVEENLKPYQDNGQIYYRTHKPIQPGTELLVFYGFAYAENLGIDMDKYHGADEDLIPYIDWEDCNEDYPSHPLTIIEDTPVPDECENRAKLSLPYGLVVKESGIPGAGEGVFAEKFIPKGVRFGPYRGNTHAYNKVDADKSGYSWIIHCGEKKVYYIDAEDKRTSNWMRYINMARNEAEENLKSFQHEGQMYYWTYKPIQPGTELLEFYGFAYAEFLGIDMGEYYADGEDNAASSSSSTSESYDFGILKINWIDCHEKSEDNYPSQPLTIVADTPLPDECENRSKLSLPPGLSVKESGIPGAGEGVWADKFFPEGVRFGPYGGETLFYTKAGSEKTGYAWVIYCDGEKVFYTDGINERISNWIRYINMARTESEQNVQYYQHLGQVYYRTYKPVQPGTELLVSYGDAYGKHLGIDMDKYYDT